VGETLNADGTLSEQLEYVLSRSAFYKEKYAGCGITSENAANRFSELPFTEKQELLDDQEAHPPFGANLCAELAEVQRIQKTSGTSNRPVLIALTPKDIETTVSVGATCFRAAGLEPTDVVVHCLNYCLWMGGYTDHQSLERTGATVVPYGVGNTVGLVEFMFHAKPTAIHCTPSYLAKLEAVLAEQFGGASPKEFGLKKGLFAGEGGLQYPNFRQRIEEKWGLCAINANYGVSEALSMIAAECAERDGLHFMAGDALLPELIDPATTDPIPIETGAQGELVLTNLCRLAQPLIRYRTRDVISVVRAEPCDCGRSSFRFQVTGRSDEMLVVKGINVYPSAIRSVIDGFPDMLNGEYQIVVSATEPLAEIAVKAEHVAGLSPDALESLATTLGQKIRHVINIAPRVALCKEGELPRTEGKTRRVVREANDEKIGI